MTQPNLTPLQIAVYAVNCPNDDKSVDEVAHMIELYAINSILKELSPIDDWKAPNKRYQYFKDQLDLLKEAKWQKQDFEASKKIESFLTKWPKQCKAKSNAECKFGECDCSEISNFILPA